MPYINSMFFKGLEVAKVKLNPKFFSHLLGEFNKLVEVRGKVTSRVQVLLCPRN